MSPFALFLGITAVTTLLLRRHNQHATALAA